MLRHAVPVAVCHPQGWCYGVRRQRNALKLVAPSSLGVLGVIAVIDPSKTDLSKDVSAIADIFNEQFMVSSEMRTFRLIVGVLSVAAVSACQGTGSYTIDVDGSAIENNNVAGYTGGTSYSGVPAGGSASHLSDLTATGYATIDDQPGDSPALRRLMAIRVAKLDAYRVLAAQVYGQYIDASTSIGDMVMADEHFEARVRGVIFGAKLERINPVGTTTYEVTLSLPTSSVRDLRRLYLSSVAISQR